MSKSVTCPVCGRPGVVTLVESIDAVRSTEGHEITFDCAGGRHRLTETEMLILWAADRQRH